jgi:hypothetical protein
MITDNLTYMSDGQTVTGSAASTNYIDTLAAGGAYDGSWVVVKTGANAWATLTSLVVSVQSADNTGFSNATTHYSTAALLPASLTANTTLVKFKIPQNTKRYVRVYYTVAGSNATGPALASAFVTGDVSFQAVS